MLEIKSATASAWLKSNFPFKKALRVNSPALAALQPLSINNLIISLWSKNVTDVRYAVRGFYFGLEPPNYEEKLYLSYGNPKEIGIKLSYQF